MVVEVVVMVAMVSVYMSLYVLLQTVGNANILTTTIKAGEEN